MASLEGKKVLVTGASGFIGEHLCRRLFTEGAEIHGISRKRSDNLSSGITWWFGDLADLSFTRDSILEINPEIIFHLASHVVGHRELHAVQPTFHGNLHSAVNLLTVATEVGTRRIIIVGSQEEPDFSESSQAVPSSPYAAAKWAASSYARMCHALYQTPVTIARVFMVYGPGQKDTKKLIPYTILSLLDGIAPSLTSGERPVDWIYVGDVAEGLLAMALSDRLDGRTVDLGSGSFVTVRKIVENIADLIDGDVYPQFGSVAQRPMEQVRKACSQETKELIGWQANTSIIDGLKATIQWYRENIGG
ncbi:MAG: NAD-dependent epimerase/dehydratase family protein [Pseudomonadota bacterium]